MKAIDDVMATIGAMKKGACSRGKSEPPPSNTEQLPPWPEPVRAVPNGFLRSALFGAIGAFLALPIVASIQTIARTYTKRYDLVDSPLMDDPVPDKKSKLVEGAEVLSEHLHNMPRAVQGSSAHVPIPDEVRQLQEQAYNITRSDETGDADESQTVAIPKHVLDGVDRKPLRGTAEADGAQTEAGPQVADGSQSQGTDDNPRSRWR